jgi:hypothetical protein
MDQARNALELAVVKMLGNRDADQRHGESRIGRQEIERPDSLDVFQGEPDQRDIESGRIRLRRPPAKAPPLPKAKACASRRRGLR